MREKHKKRTSVALCDACLVVLGTNCALLLANFAWHCVLLACHIDKLYNRFMEQEKENSIQLSTATAPTMKQPRNCAFDIARIIAMFLIVSSHFLGHGGFANNMTGANFVFGRILTSLFNPSVNLFVLIGAYFTCTSKKLKWQRLAKLYAQVWIYSMTLFVVFLCIYGKESFSWNWLLS